MNTTIRHTEYLVTEHNCVVLQGLGAILVSRRSACVHPDGSITPPCATYAFNSEVVHTDGVLENSIARAEGISYERAAAIVRTDLETMRRQLDAEGSLSLGRIGNLLRNADGCTVRLETFPTDLLTPMANWLPAIPPATEIHTGQTPMQAIETRRTPRLRRFVRAAAAAAAMICIGLVASTPITVSNAHYASTALPEVTGPKEAFVPRQTPATLNLAFTEAPEPCPVDTAARTAWQQEMARALTPSDDARQTPAPDLTDLRLNSSDAYCVIVASLTCEEDAQEFVSYNQRRHGLQFAIIENGGRWRVYAATASTAAAAKQAAGALTAFPDAWVCRLN